LPDASRDRQAVLAQGMHDRLGVFLKDVDSSRRDWERTETRPKRPCVGGVWRFRASSVYPDRPCTVMEIHRHPSRWWLQRERLPAEGRNLCPRKSTPKPDEPESCFTQRRRDAGFGRPLPPCYLCGSASLREYVLCCGRRPRRSGVRHVLKQSERLVVCPSGHILQGRR